MKQDSSTEQPAAPAGECCWHCGRELDQMRGMAWWRGRWWCLLCFVR